ncbi:MAG: DUF4838 domain-containing protein [Bacteroidota bacterium]
MKHFTLLLLSVFLIISCNQNKELTLVDNQKTDYKIVVEQSSDSITQIAAKELQNYIAKISDVRLEISNEFSPDSKSIIIGKALINDSSVLSELGSLKADGFIIKTNSDQIIISGGEAKSNLYATYTFIEEFLGCKLLSSTEEFIPETDIISIPITDNKYEPAFSFRRTLFPGQFSSKYRFWHKIEELDEWGMFVHTFDDLVPQGVYFEEHPEYFSMVGGRRLSDAQLCLSNPDLLQLLIDNLRIEIEKQPEKIYWSVSQNDAYNFCECDECKTMYEKYGSVSGAYIYMSNKIAKEFPDKQISTLAYQFTRSAPTNITPLDNVNIMFCSIECNRSMPLEEDERSAEFVKDMKDWSQLTNNFFIWDYVVQFKNYLTPFPNFHVLQPNIQFFNKYDVGMMFQQGSSRNWSDLADLKQYVISKLLWDPNANVDEIVNDFMNKYYGPASPYIMDYYNLTHKAITENQEKEFLNIYGFPSDYIDSYLTPDLLVQYKDLMDKAETSVYNEPVYLNRVLKTRLPVDFAYLDIALNKNIGEISFVREVEGNLELRPEMVDYLNRFVEISKQTGITVINERNFRTEAYQKYALHKLERMTKKNLAKGKTIKLLTEHSEKYPVGGIDALTDGLYGDLDFHNNWLGFEGHDMIVEIDLQKPETIYKVSANFLKAVNSWVFLPVEITVEVSSDGINYKKAGIVNGDNSDKNYLVKSIPFIVELDEVETQYLRITANSLKECPEWHRGYGNPSWIFIDELVIE